MSMPLAAAVAALAFTSSASAQSGNPFGCTASTASASLQGTNLLPGATSANQANVPCADGSSLLNPTTVTNVPGLTLSLGPVSAQTTLGTSPAGGSTYTEADSESTVNALNLAVSGLSLQAGPSTADVDYACVDNQLVKHYGSTLKVITINGRPINLTGLPQDLSVPGVATILVNQHASTASSDTETLLYVQLLGGAGTGLALDAGQAQASQTQSDPCAATSPGRSTGAPVNVGGSGGSGSGSPTIDGADGVGMVLTANPGLWSGAQPITYTYQWYRDGRAIRGARHSTYRTTLLDAGQYLTFRVTAHNADGARTADSARLRIPYPPGCPAASGTVGASLLGRAQLGDTRKQARRAFIKVSRRGYRYEDFFCLAPSGVRVGYASPTAMRLLRRSQRAALANRVVWISTSNTKYAIRGIRPGAKLAAAKRKLHLGRGFKVGRNTWYLGRLGNQEVILKAPGKTVQEIGIANRALTRTRAEQRTFVRSFS
ncbi:MAG: hypothetical protein JOZ07_03125 [Solirubrobacterales bacterium]|nr:hypothetical protein [Solirubrobacterales bacterium]